MEGLEVQSLGCTCVVLLDACILQLFQGLFRDNGKGNANYYNMLG